MNDQLLQKTKKQKNTSLDIYDLLILNLLEVSFMICLSLD